MLLMALLLGAGQYAAFTLFDYIEREPRASAAALQAVSVVNLTRAALLAAHEQRRLPLLTELSQTEGVRVYPIEIFEEVEPLPDDPLIQLIAAKIVAQLGEGTIVSVNHLGLPGLWVSFSIEGDDFWVVIPKIRTAHRSVWQWLEWGILILGMALGGAYFIAARINRPLQLLVNAAEQVAHGRPVDKLPEHGVTELQMVSKTFNEMTDALERLDSERTLLLAGVSHDLRTPLARLRLAVEMLPQSDGLKAGMVQDIEDMDNIIRQFLDFVRGLEGEPSQLGDLNSLLQSVSERYTRNDKRIHLDLAPLPSLHFRPLAMHRLVSNLIDNALHYAGEPVTLRTRAEDARIVLSVLDIGPGIPEPDIPRLLRPFERLDTARGKDSGSGLGLAIADRIAKMHAAEMTLHNRPAGGLEVKITFHPKP